MRNDEWFWNIFVRSIYRFDNILNKLNRRSAQKFIGECRGGYNLPQSILGSLNDFWINRTFAHFLFDFNRIFSWLNSEEIVLESFDHGMIAYSASCLVIKCLSHSVTSKQWKMSLKSTENALQIHWLENNFLTTDFFCRLPTLNQIIRQSVENLSLYCRNARKSKWN